MPSSVNEAKTCFSNVMNHMKPTHSKYEANSMLHVIGGERGLCCLKTSTCIFHTRTNQIKQFFQINPYIQNSQRRLIFYHIIYHTTFHTDYFKCLYSQVYNILNIIKLDTLLNKLLILCCTFSLNFNKI